MSLFLKRGVKRIFVVVGYKKEMFVYLTEKYKGLTLVENREYKEKNNISSLYMAREYIGDAMILDGDQIIYNNSVLAPEFVRSGYNAVWVENGTDEWLMTVKDDIVTNCSRVGGKEGWQLFSISRWNTEDGERLKKHLETEFERKKNTQIYWDDIAMFLYQREYRLGIYPMSQGDIVEVDNLYELAALDRSYAAE